MTCLETKHYPLLTSPISYQRKEIARIVPIAVHPAFIQPSLQKSNFPFDQLEKWLFVCFLGGFDVVFKMCNHGGCALWKPIHALSWRRVLICSFSSKPRLINLLFENQVESFSIKCFPYTHHLNNG